MTRHVDAGFWGGRCVIITGASSGIGRELAGQVGAMGGRVGLIARSDSRLAEASDGILAGGGQAAWMTADVTDRAAVAHATAALQERLGPADVLIAGAGIYRLTDGAALDSEVAAEVIHTNVSGTLHAIGAVLGPMVERRTGHVAIIASVAGMLGLPGAGAYCASKAAVIMLARSLRVDLRGTGVKVTTVCPGTVDTPMISRTGREAGKGVMPVDEAARRILRAIERGGGECGFPRGLWLLSRLIHAAPAPVRHLCDRYLPRLDEGEPLPPH